MQEFENGVTITRVGFKYVMHTNVLLVRCLTFNDAIAM
jgi:hypothetical protein